MLTSSSSIRTPEDRDIVAWMEKTIGGTVSSISKLRRWRPVWRVDVAKDDGSIKSLLVKGTRAWEAIPYSLWHEMRLNQLLEESGIGVPHVYGMIEGFDAFVMDWSEGDRDPGLVQQSIEQASGMSEDRWQASLEYMDILARMHAIPVEVFAETEVGDPQTPERIALDHYERNYQLAEKRDAVNATIEFFTLWLRRNYPRGRTERSFVTGDCGQFLSKDGRVTAVLDVEIGHIGDPMHDLACFRGRHPVENMGDVPALFRRYAQASGRPLDVNAIAYHTVAFLALATIAPILALAERHRGGDWVEAVSQFAWIGRRTCDAMAEIMGVEFEPISLPAPHVVPYAELAAEKLQSEIGYLPESEEFADWQKKVLLSIPQFQVSWSRYGRWVEEEDLREIAEVLGEPVDDIVSADRKLKAYVRNAGPEEDARLLTLFHRRAQRMCLLLAGADAPADHLLFVRVEPIFDKDLG